MGDFIKADDTIVEISTDKVDLELPSPASGTVTEILIEEGETVTVGQVIARIAVDGSARLNRGETGAQRRRGPSTPHGRFLPTQAPEGVKVSPVAARAAAVEGVDLASVPGSGPAGRITKSDVLTAAADNGPPQMARPRRRPVRAPSR